MMTASPARRGAEQDTVLHMRQTPRHASGDPAASTLPCNSVSASTKVAVIQRSCGNGALHRSTLVETQVSSMKKRP
jgi:hypothetical protein